MATPALDDQNEPLENGLHRDRHGFAGPFPNGDGPRRNPLGEFPTGPDVGTRLPDVVAANHDGSSIDVHAARGQGPLALVFYRSAVW
ncbi:MAG: hypothetical protein AAF548_07825 [Actinomycetota bacterium]